MTLMVTVQFKTLSSESKAIVLMSPILILRTFLPQLIRRQLFSKETSPSILSYGSFRSLTEIRLLTLLKFGSSFVAKKQ